MPVSIAKGVVHSARGWLSLGLALWCALAAPARAEDAANSAAAPAAASAGATIHFVNDVVPLLTKHGCNSGGCHGRGSGQNGFKLSLFGFDPPADYAALVDEGGGRRISWTAPDESLMLLKASGQLPHGGGARFATDSAAYAQLRAWIAQGTAWGSDEAPKLVSIDVAPGERVLDAGQSVQLAVVARYSDSSTRDVTPLAEYFSQQPMDLAVSPAGLVRVLSGKGESVITVRYMGIVAASRFTIPYRRDLSDQAYAGFEPKTFIDRLVLEKWRKLGLAPSPPAGDAEFLRRAFLDAIGTLPTPQEVRDFLADTGADKRDRLVDRLLAREEYATFWSQRWGDLLRIKQNFSAGDHKEDSQKFADWVRNAFAQNMHFDQFARELIAVTGKWEDHPQMDWYRMLNSPQNRVEDTAQVFLGLRVSCANCHNHPFERISQNDYWQYAAFFARVDAMTYGSIKTVGIKEEGSIKNPRTGEEMTPKAFSGPEVPYVKGEDPRQKLVDWMVAKDNPYFARAISNRIWGHYMKRGLVEALDDLRATNPPSNPALLDALAADLVEHGYDLKHLTAQVMKSRVYGLSSVPAAENAADKQNYARHYPKRMLPHVMLDSISAATGILPKFNEFPNAKRAIQLPNEVQYSEFLDIFGRSRRDTACVCETHVEPNLSQVLWMLFDQGIQNDVTNSEGALIKMIKDNRPNAEIIEDLYLRTLSRPPTPADAHDALELVDAAGPNKQQVLEDLFWVLLNSKEFLFIH